jgi:orotate phosphoribosyltransferase
VLDDVVTTAGSSLKAIAALREAGAVVADAIAVVDREEGAAAAFAAEAITLHALYRKSAFTDRT